MVRLSERQVLVERRTANSSVAMGFRPPHVETNASILEAKVLRNVRCYVLKNGFSMFFFVVNRSIIVIFVTLAWVAVYLR